MFRQFKEAVPLVWFLFFFGFAVSPVFAGKELKLGKTTVDSGVNDPSAHAAAAAEPSLKEVTSTFETTLQLAVDSGLKKAAEPVNMGLNEISRSLPPPKKLPANVLNTENKPSQTAAAALISSTPTVPAGSPQPASSRDSVRSRKGKPDRHRC